jgi:hypothetical protein
LQVGAYLLVRALNKLLVGSQSGEKLPHFLKEFRQLERKIKKTSYLFLDSSYPLKRRLVGKAIGFERLAHSKTHSKSLSRNKKSPLLPTRRISISNTRQQLPKPPLDPCENAPEISTPL